MQPKLTINVHCTTPEIIDKIQHDLMKGSNNNTEVRPIRYFILFRLPCKRKTKPEQKKMSQKNQMKKKLIFNISSVSTVYFVFIFLSFYFVKCQI